MKFHSVFSELNLERRRLFDRPRNFSCHSQVTPYVARSTLPRRDDLRTWSRAAGPRQRVRSRRLTMEQQLAERGVPKRFGTKHNAKSYQCPGQPGAAQADLKKSERLPRTPFETFPLRKRRDDESPVLGLSRPQNTQTNVPVSLDPALERGRARTRN